MSFSSRWGNSSTLRAARAAPPLRGITSGPPLRRWASSTISGGRYSFGLAATIRRKSSKKWEAVISAGLSLRSAGLGHDEPFRRDYREGLASTAEGRKPAASQTPRQAASAQSGSSYRPPTASKN